MKPYQPQPGTIPFKAIEHLKSLPAGTELTTADLCEAIGFDGVQFQLYMAVAVKHGMVTSVRKRGSRFLHWSLGTGKPIVDPTDDTPEPEEAKAEVPVFIPRPAPWPFGAAGAQLPDADPEPEAEPQQGTDVEQPVLVEMAPAASGPASFALWSDGRLAIQRGRRQIEELSPDETKALLAYLERMAECEA